MRVDLISPQELDDSTASQLAAIYSAATAVDAPHESPVSTFHVKSRLIHGWDGYGTDHVLLARTDSGAIAAAAEIELPRWDNLHVGAIQLETRPDLRGQGYGDALLEASMRMLRELGRTTVLGNAWADSHRLACWERHGFAIVTRDAQRRIITADIDWDNLDTLHAQSLAASTDYDIIELGNPAPSELMDDLLELQRAMNDAPIDDMSVDDEVWSADRYRGYERSMTARNIRLVRLLARRRSDGQLGGHTVVAIEDERPTLGFQEDTSVIATHRGHKLGLRLKIEMLQLLAEREPQLRLIDTWNAESNAHMLAVNDAIGCFVVAKGVEVEKTQPA